MYNFTIPMALMDFVPVVFFGITAVLLLGDLYNKMSKAAYALFAAGSASGENTIQLKSHPRQVPKILQQRKQREKDRHGREHHCHHPCHNAVDAKQQHLIQP